ncbi:MAG: RNB domain-containing ribonuclease [Elusimicrobiota bacterium]|jgi:exoribonuclease R/endonuclease I
MTTNPPWLVATLLISLLRPSSSQAQTVVSVHSVPQNLPAALALPAPSQRLALPAPVATGAETGLGLPGLAVRPVLQLPAAAADAHAVPAAQGLPVVQAAKPAAADTNAAVKTPSKALLPVADAQPQKSLPSVGALLESVDEPVEGKGVETAGVGRGGGRLDKLFDGAGGRGGAPAGVPTGADVQSADAYPAYLRAQFEGVRRIHGDEAVVRLQDDIRLAKRFFAEVLGDLEVGRGGLADVAVEQLIMQSGVVAPAQKGRSIEEPGSFDKFIDRITLIGFDEQGRERSLTEARRLWVVHNPLRSPANVLDLFGKAFWSGELIHGAKAYREARSLGGAIDFAQLRSVALANRKLSGKAEFSGPSVHAVSKLTVRTVRKVVAGAVAELGKNGIVVMDSKVSERRVDRRNIFDVSFRVADEGSTAAAEAALKDALLRQDPEATFQEKPAERRSAMSAEEAAAVGSFDPEAVKAKALPKKAQDAPVVRASRAVEQGPRKQAGSKRPERSVLRAAVAAEVETVASSPDGTLPSPKVSASLAHGQTSSAGPIPGVDFTAEQLERVRTSDESVARGVRAAMQSILREGEAVEVISRGSTSRLTHSDENPDYDIQVDLPAQWNAKDVAQFVERNLDAIQAALSKHVRRETAWLFPGVKTGVQTGGVVSLTDPDSGKLVEGVYMLPVHVQGPEGLLLDVDVTLTNRPEYANAYPEYFDAQLGAVLRLGGEGADVRLLRDIRLAKRFFSEVIGSYKFWRGGPTGVGVEQLVIQSGRVADADQGRTILEAGSFDKLMDRLVLIGFDAQGRARSVEEARRLWSVHNPFMAPANFLDLLGRGYWAKLIHAARNYREGRAEGRAIDLQALKSSVRGVGKAGKSRRERQSPPSVSSYEDAGGDASIGSVSKLSARDMRVAIAGAIQNLEKRGISLKKPRVAGAPMRSVKGRHLHLFDIGFRVSDESVIPAVKEEIENAVLQKDAEATFMEPEEPSSRSIEQTGAEKPQAPRPQVRPRSQGPSRKDAVPPAVTLRSAAQPPAVAQTPVPAEPPRAGEPGAMTLEMLRKFTLTGPEPLARGDAFLYAQGAKALPAGLEGGAVSAAELVGDESAPTPLVRRDGSISVRLETTDPDGNSKMKFVSVPVELAQGIPSDALVQVRFDGKKVLSVRPVGAYRADVVIGRVLRGKEGELRLSALFSDDPSRTLYAPLPLAAGAKVLEGSILQAFVRPLRDGRFEAVPLADFGAAITPEIAAREIALRYGARGYFDEAVIRQAEEIGRTQDPAADFRRMKESKGRTEDLRALPFVTVDPIGAGDLDDAYYVEKSAEGGYTWYLATSDVAQYVQPGTPAFRAAARIGNTFYTLDKDGVPEYPMNHPVVSKNVSSLLDGKDSLSMISKMSFSPEGKFLPEKSEVFLGLVRVQGRYTYDQVAALWEGKPDHGIAHLEQVSLARELSGKLDAHDEERGKLKLEFEETRYRKLADGSWKAELVMDPPLVKESHHIIEELKVYGNQAIAARLDAISKDHGIPHISRVHPPQTEERNLKLRTQLLALGVPWEVDEPLWTYLKRLQALPGASQELKNTAQMLTLMSRNSAKYAADDALGHEGLALGAEAYDHPSTPLRRFSDMYNRALLETYLEGGDPKTVHAAVLADLKEMGFESFDEYLEHLNGREQASRKMDREMDAFMSVYELSKPENQGRPLAGYVKMVREGKTLEATIQLRDVPVTLVLREGEAKGYKMLDEVTVNVRSADLYDLGVDASITKKGGRPSSTREKGREKGNGKREKRPKSERHSQAGRHAKTADAPVLGERRSSRGDRRSSQGDRRSALEGDAQPRFIEAPAAPSAGASKTAYLGGLEGLSGKELAWALGDVVSARQRSRGKYKTPPYLYRTADSVMQRGQRGLVDPYSGVFVPGTGREGKQYLGEIDGNGVVTEMSLEHVWPQSFFEHDEPMVSDLHHLMAVFRAPNHLRGRMPFGEAKDSSLYENKAGARSDGVVFEPPDFSKGRIARALLYFFVRYCDEDIFRDHARGFWAPHVETYLRWNREHPPTDFERRRNDVVEGFQGNRNPFVDDPTLADRIGVEALRWPGTREDPDAPSPEEASEPTNDAEMRELYGVGTEKDERTSGRAPGREGSANDRSLRSSDRSRKDARAVSSKPARKAVREKSRSRKERSSEGRSAKKSLRRDKRR